MPTDANAPGPALEAETEHRTPDLGDLVIVLLAGTLAGLRDRLNADGYPEAAGCVGAAVDVTDAYLETVVTDG